MTRRILSLVGVATLCLVIAAMGAPATVPSPRNIDDKCCAAPMLGHSDCDFQEEGSDCPSESSPKEDCMSCCVCLVFVCPPTGVSLFPPAASDWRNVFVFNQVGRSDQPPVPPPRSATA